MNRIPPVCFSLAEALIDDPFYRAATVDSAADEENRRLILARYFALAIEEASGIGEVRCAGDDGAAVWITGEANPGDIETLSRMRTQALAGLLGAAGFGNYVGISGSMEEKLPAHLAGAWYLSILGVRPEARGQGLAQQLLEPTLERADRLGATCFLETFNPMSLPFYRRLGFDRENPRFEEITARPYWILTRQR